MCYNVGLIEPFDRPRPKPRLYIWSKSPKHVIHNYPCVYLYPAYNVYTGRNYQLNTDQTCINQTSNNAINYPINSV